MSSFEKRKTKATAKKMTMTKATWSKNAWVCTEPRYLLQDSESFQAGGFRSLQEGQTVQFDVTKGPKGFQAENVQPV
jgi:hypothetical protein